MFSKKSRSINQQKLQKKNIKNMTASSVTLPDSSQTVAIIDPPRRGCSQELIDGLLGFCPHTIIYVSCDPTSQARDADKICRQNYEIIDVTPFDMFPQTRHVENIIVFRRKKI
jgi:tRNA/tmRNA/rRNA uracil-C5-methylase (TrmA/RlmC/RlmD family)